MKGVKLKGKNNDGNTKLRCETVVIMVFIKKSSLNERATRNCWKTQQKHFRGDSNPVEIFAKIHTGDEKFLAQVST